MAPYFHHFLILLSFLLTRAIFKGVGQAETLADTKQGENRRHSISQTEQENEGEHKGEKEGNRGRKKLWNAGGKPARESRRGREVQAQREEKKD